jgi:Acyl-CoA dehydrogenase, C-terminal domain
MIDHSKSAAAVREGLDVFLEHLLGTKAGDFGIDALEAWEEVCRAGWLEIGSRQNLDKENSEGYSEFAAAMEAFGAQLFPGPIVGVAGYLVPLLSSLVSNHAHVGEWLGSIYNGHERPILFPDSLSDAPVRLEASADQRFRISAVFRGMLCTPQPTHCYLPVFDAASQWQLLRVAVNATGVSVAFSDTPDAGTTVATVTLENVEVGPSDLIGTAVETAARPFDDANLLFSLGLDAAAIGGAARVIDQTVSYANNREQFGVAIGTFQALQHVIANAVVSLELAKSLMYESLTLVAQRDPSAKVSVAASRIFASEMYMKVAAAAIQCHGGYGFTWEQGVHFFYRRAIVDRQIQTSVTNCQREIRAELEKSSGQLDA